MMLNDEYQSMAANAICHQAFLTGETLRQEYTRPSIMLKPRLLLDGDQWCALYGETIQDGVAGFGKSPVDAMDAFDRAFFAKLPQSPTKGTAMGIQTLAERFCAAPLPESVCVDAVATRPGPGRTGTNLLTVEEAKIMLTHVLGDTLPEIAPQDERDNHGGDFVRV